MFWSKSPIAKVSKQATELADQLLDALTLALEEGNLENLKDAIRRASDLLCVGRDKDKGFSNYFSSLLLKQSRESLTCMANMVGDNPVSEIAGSHPLLALLQSAEGQVYEVASNRDERVTVSANSWFSFFTSGSKKAENVERRENRAESLATIQAPFVQDAEPLKDFEGRAESFDEERKESSGAARIGVEDDDFVDQDAGVEAIAETPKAAHELNAGKITVITTDEAPSVLEAELLTNFEGRAESFDEGWSETSGDISVGDLFAARIISKEDATNAKHLDEDNSSSGRPVWRNSESLTWRAEFDGCYVVWTESLKSLQGKAGVAALVVGSVSACGAGEQLLQELNEYAKNDNQLCKPENDWQLKKFKQLVVEAYKEYVKDHKAGSQSLQELAPNAMALLKQHRSTGLYGLFVGCFATHSASEVSKVYEARGPDA